MSNEINVGAISEALNNKVDLNQLNTNEQGLDYVSGLSMPSDRYIELTMGASNTLYTAPANGYFCICGEASSSSTSIVSLNNNSNHLKTRTIAYSSGTDMQVFIPAKKGDTVLLEYSNFVKNQDYMKFVFIYAEGAE